MFTYFLLPIFCFSIKKYPVRHTSLSVFTAGSPNFLKLLHDLVTAHPRTDSYAVFEWIPLEGLSSNANAANTSTGSKKGAKDSVQRYCCVARLKLRVENAEEGLKRSEVGLSETCWIFYCFHWSF